MRRFRGWAPCAGLAVWTLAACAATPTTPAPNVNPSFARTSVARWGAPAWRDPGTSWASSEVKKSKAPFLFVSDSGTSDVYIYKLPSLKVIAKITGFSQPQGECSDSKGNVWVTDTNAREVYEVSHRGYLENKLSITAGFPDGCAWDSTTGNLAVMLLFGGTNAAGGVLIYRKASGTPVEYQNPKQYYYNFGGYDDGTLFFDGRDAQGNFMLSALPKGAKAAKTIGLSGGTIYFPGMVQWNGGSSNLIVGDQSCGDTYASCIYSVNVASSAGTITGVTNLQGYQGSSICDVVQAVEFNGQILGSDDDFCGSSPNATYAWRYPAGGAPLDDNNTTDVTPVGATISI